MGTDKIIITGSSGLIGSEAVRLFTSLGYEVHGIDNNSRKMFFGMDGDTSWNLERTKAQTKSFIHHDLDIRDAERLYKLFREIQPVHVLHCAAQPAHEYSSRYPVADFNINVTATLNLLEACRKCCPETVFVFCSSSKVYGPVNEIPYVETATRFDFDTEVSVLKDIPDLIPAGWSFEGISEGFPLEPGEARGIYGTDKAAADLLVQEYGLTYGLRTVSLRGNCMTGPGHAAAQLHGFIAYLARCIIMGRTYTIFGHKGKQVRDILHSYDYVKAIEMICMSPPVPGTVYNIGGGRNNSLSVLEAITTAESVSGKRLEVQYEALPRHGDHRIFITDCSKFRQHYPPWAVTYSIEQIFQDLVYFNPWNCRYRVKGLLGRQPAGLQ